MIAKAIYHNLQRIDKIYHSGAIVFQESIANPVEFHVIDDGKLIILGAMEANSLPGGLYLDCAPEWVYPVVKNHVLTIEQVYSATVRNHVLEVE